MVKILTAKEAVETYFYSGATVTFGGFANGLMHPEAIMAALEQAGRAGRLRDLKVVFASGQGKEQRILSAGSSETAPTSS